MKFYISKLVLWLNNGKKREIEFKPNKVNVIIGDSHTGKTAILDIIDYCLFASEHTISESVINERTHWYGIQFAINNKFFTIARESPTKNVVSSKYYFSSVGEIPYLPLENMPESSVKEIIEAEFGIDHNVKIPFGGNAIQSGSKISLRYFLLFNTISQNIITNTDVYFDKQNESRYREALPRIFDLALGINDIENILKQEKYDEIETEIHRFKKKNDRIEKEKKIFYLEMSDLIKKANEYGLINETLDINNSVKELDRLIKDIVANVHVETNEYDNLYRMVYLLKRKIRNLNRFKKEYEEYKKNLSKTQDSLSPLLFIAEMNQSLIKTSVFHEIIQSIELDFNKIKQTNKARTPIDAKISDHINEYENKVKKLNDILSTMSDDRKTFENEREKYIFIGEVKAKLTLYKNDEKNDVERNDKEIRRLEGILDQFDIRDVTESRKSCVSLLEEIIKDYMSITKNALANYGSYNPSFNYKDKTLQLRKLKSDHVEHVGSSSNHMFLHLFLFLGLHELINRKNVSFTPAFLIIDQPSRPYYGEGKENNKELEASDRSKITTAFKLMNTFMNTMISTLNKDFQIIVFEHVPEEIWEGMNNVHLVAKFYGNNALIPSDLMD